MAYHDCKTEGTHNKLENLKSRLECVTAEKVRLEAAIAFLEANPGALALVNSF